MVWVLGYGLNVNVRLASGLRPGDSEVMLHQLVPYVCFILFHFMCFLIVLSLLSGRSVGRQVLC
jgi:hypothetical protein